MVERIKETKDQILERMEQTISERGIDRVDVNEMGKLADIVKDLAEAEKACWEAEYYMAVTEAMDEYGYEEGMGYEQGGQGGGSGYAQGGQGGGGQGGSGYRRGYARGGQGGGGQGGSGYRRGYRGQPRDSMGRYSSRRGYRRRYGHGDMMQDIREMMEGADPQEREQLKQQLKQMTQEM